MLTAALGPMGYKYILGGKVPVRDGDSLEFLTGSYAHVPVAFSNRTEARWAVFFDALSIRWEYEPEGYFINDIPYRPSFRLPDFSCFWEVRENENYDSGVMLQLADATLSAVFVAVGNPEPGHESKVFYPDNGGDVYYIWCECPRCGKLGIQFQGRAERNRCECFSSQKEKVYGFDSYRLHQAYRRAADDRFINQFVTALAAKPSLSEYLPNVEDKSDPATTIIGTNDRPLSVFISFVLSSRRKTSE